VAHKPASLCTKGRKKPCQPRRGAIFALAGLLHSPFTDTKVLVERRSSRAGVENVEAVRAIFKEGQPNATKSEG
jgi:hypothetical protein